MTIEDPLVSAHGYRLLPLPTSQLVGIIGNFMFQAYFELYYSLFMEGSLQPLMIHH